MNKYFNNQRMACLFFENGLLRVMKTTLILLLVSLRIVASEAYSQYVDLKLSLKNTTVKELIYSISEQTGYEFSYDASLLDKKIRSVSVNAENEYIEVILEQAFRNTGISYRVQNNRVFLKDRQVLEIPRAATAVQQQERTVSGVIVDAAGVPVIGANVMVKGTSNGTVTDLDGRFTLSGISENATLVITYIGYQTQEVSTRNRSSFQITIQEDTQNLEEVVVVGYGVQKKVNLTGSVSTVRFDEEMANRPITNASQALSGKVPGLWVSQNSGKPGDDGAQLRVRGWGTLNEAAPHIVVDGVQLQGDLSQINPNDIESISVLKDAASAAIYGSKAANGVILITTKMGLTNEKIQVDFNTYAGVQMLGRRFDLVTNSAESMELINMALTNGGASPLFPENMVEAFRMGNDKYKYPNTNWFKELYEKAFINEYNLSIRGGTQKSTSYLSFNYLNHDGMVPNTGSYRYNIRANLNSEIKDWLKIGGRFSYMRRVTEEPYDMARVFEMLRGISAFTAPYTRDGRFGSVEVMDDDGVLLYDNRNPLIDAANGNTQNTTDMITVNAFFNAKFTPELMLNTNVSSSGTWRMTDRYNTNVYGYTDSGMETITKNLNREGLDMSRRQETSLRNIVYATLDYNKKFSNNHTIGVILGSQLESYIYKFVYGRRNEAPKTGLTQVNAGTGGIRGEGNMEGLRMFSYFSRLNYSYKDRYLFEANFRADASSRFSKNNRWGYFPGFSAGWRLSEEDIIKNMGLFSNLKLRTSWGQLGNQVISGYWPYLTVINQNNALSYSYDNSFSAGAAVTALVDENITWETTTSLDVGLDLGFLNNRLNGEVNYFRKITSDIIVQLPIPMLLGGISAPFENVGKMLNQGVEINVSYDNGVADTDRLGLNIGMNMAYIHNEVTKFRGGKSPDQLYLIREGHSYQTLYGYKAAGIYQTDEEALSHMHSNSYKPKAGNLKFEDMNNDGKLGFEDKQDIGNTIPKLTYGLTVNLQYKNFDLNLLFQGTGLAHIYTQNSITRMEYEYMTISTKYRDAWSPENPTSKIPSLKFDNTWDNSESSYWVHRSDFLKLKNIQLGYLIPQTAISGLGLDKLYVFANAQNLFTAMWYKGYEGYDPERNSFGDGGAMYGTPVTLTLGLNINF